MRRSIFTIISVVWAGILTIATPVAAQEACSSAPVGDAPYQCLCAGNDTGGSVWGSNPYTADSDVCTAAVHAGAIGLGGGVVRVVPTDGLDSYEGSVANGIETRAWGSYGQSITFEIKNAGGGGGGGAIMSGETCGAYPVGQAEYSCSCEPYDGTGAVWGSGPYTADSDICLAAIHAGLIGGDGGDVRLREMPGQDSYEGSSANGVETRSWGSYGTSFDFVPESPFVLQIENAAAGGDCSAFPTGAASYDCTCGPGPYSGSVWGNGPYTSDSDLCAAARHTGVIGDEGGPITVLGLGGLDAYSGTSYNGVTTSDWGAYSESIVFNWN